MAEPMVYAPHWTTWQSLIALPNSPHKTLVKGDGSIILEPHRNTWDGQKEWLYKLSFAFDGDVTTEDAPKQSLLDGDPIVVTERFRAAQSIGRLTALQWITDQGKLFDLVHIEPVDGGTVILDWNMASGSQTSQTHKITVTDHGIEPWVYWQQVVARILDHTKEHIRVELPQATAYWIAIRPADAVLLGEFPVEAPTCLEKARKYWQQTYASCRTLTVGDERVQTFVGVSDRGLEQLREVKNGYAYVQPGASNYRGYWVLDGAFINEVMDYRDPLTVKENLNLLLGLQTHHGMFQSTVIPFDHGHWKETGVGLWNLLRHYELTADGSWAESVYPAIGRAVNWLDRLIDMSIGEYGADYPGSGLLPLGFGDGGLIKGTDYTNVFWIVAGLRSASQLAAQLNKPEAHAWTLLADYAAKWMQTAIDRDFVQKDEDGDAYIPSTVGNSLSTTGGPSKLQGQWGFMQAVYPLQVLSPHDPKVKATIDTITRYEREDTCFGIGWIADGIWTYAAGFWGPALLHSEQYDHALRVLEAYMQHASPTYSWREEQSLQGDPALIVGDMPHGWAWALYLYFVRSCAVLEGEDLRIGAAIPLTWTNPPGFRLTGHPTRFGKLWLRMERTEAKVKIQCRMVPTGVAQPQQVVFHAPRGTHFTADSDATSGSSLEIAWDHLVRGVSLTAEVAE